jgi:hypothetical protein
MASTKTKNSKNKKGLVEKVKKGAVQLKKKAMSAVCDSVCDTKKTKGVAGRVATSKKASTRRATTKRKSATKKSS